MLYTGGRQRWRCRNAKEDFMGGKKRKRVAVLQRRVTLCFSDGLAMAGGEKFVDNAIYAGVAISLQSSL
jgi:hypothetical protein